MCRMLMLTSALAARLAKADLVTGMVGEFPELQGIIGGYYAEASGEDARVAAAISSHYRPQGPSDALPDSPEAMVVALADKLDTLVGFFSIDAANWIEGSVCPAPGGAWGHPHYRRCRSYSAACHLAGCGGQILWV